VEFLQGAYDALIHLDQHLGDLVGNYGSWIYGLLFAIIFLETGIVFSPFLPKDSLLFVAGSLSARGLMNEWLLFALLSVAAILGDTCNYWIGKAFGTLMIKKGWIKRAHLDRTHSFFERYGGKTIIIARFVPIVRTFAPFVAGIGAMTYHRFIVYNVVGGVAWVAIFVFGGRLFGSLPLIKDNFGFVVIAIIIISVLPAVWEFLRVKLARPPSSGRGNSLDFCDQPATTNPGQSGPPARPS
jgi:membrane-associated protein